MGFCKFEVYPFGPAHEYAIPPVDEHVRLSEEPVAMGELLPVVIPVGTVEVNDTTTGILELSTLFIVWLTQ